MLMVFKGAKAFSRILITFQRTSLLLVVRCVFVPSGSFEDYFETFFSAVLEGDSINIVGHGTERAFLGRVNADTGRVGSTEIKGLCFVC